VNINVEVNINVPKHMSVVRNDGFWTFAASELHRLLVLYIPMMTGTTMESVLIRPKELEFVAPNAHFLNKGELMVDPKTGSSYARKGVKKVYAGKPLDLTHNKHPKSTNEWVDSAMPTEKPKLDDALQGYIDSGRLRF
jgi:hypothetical protein